MKLHPTKVEATTDNFQLGKKIMQMRYDQVLQVLDGMVAETFTQMRADDERGRAVLAGRLEYLGIALNQAVKAAEYVCNTCESYIEAEENHDNQ